MFPCLTNPQVTGYSLGHGIRVGIERRKEIVKLVVLGLRHEPPSVPPDYRVLHPAAYLSYNNPDIK